MTENNFIYYDKTDARKDFSEEKTHYNTMYTRMQKIDLTSTLLTLNTFFQVK